MSARPQAISGVSPSEESIVMTVFPSIAATGLGRCIGQFCDCIPLKIVGVKLSNLLFAPPAIPFALLLYLGMKVFGRRYVLTNRSVQVWNCLGTRQFQQVPLADVDRIQVEQLAGQKFYRAANLLLGDSSGKLLLQLHAVPQADVFRQIILEARDARVEVEQSLATIHGRQPA